MNCYSMNVNIINLIIEFSFPETICLECDNSFLDKSLFFNKNIKNKIKLCDYHNMKKLFSEHVKRCTSSSILKNDFLYDNNFSFHNNTGISKEIFKKIIIDILKENNINNYHFCCNGGGVMYYHNKIENIFY